jgi:hypothetical protein
MEVHLKHIIPPLQPTYLASAAVEVIFDNGDKLTVSDLRVLRHESAGILWVGFPTRSIGIGRFNIVQASTALRKRIAAA